MRHPLCLVPSVESSFVHNPTNHRSDLPFSRLLNEFTGGLSPSLSPFNLPSACTLTGGLVPAGVRSSLQGSCAPEPLQPSRRLRDTRAQCVGHGYPHRRAQAQVREGKWRERDWGGGEEEGGGRREEGRVCHCLLSACVFSLLCVMVCASTPLLSLLCPIIENRNRAFEGDMVVVVLLPIDQWGARGSEELTHKNTATVADALQGTFHLLFVHYYFL